MNLPELLGAAGARPAPKLPDSGVESVDDGDSDAFMASVISAGSHSDGGTTEDSQIGHDELAQSEGGHAKSGPNHSGADDSADAEAAVVGSAASTPDQVQPGRNDEATRTLLPLATVDPEALATRAATTETPAAMLDGNSDIRSGNDVVTTEVTARDGSGMREVASANGANSSGVQPGDRGHSAQSGATAKATPNQIALNASGQGGKGQTPEMQGALISAAGPPAQVPARQATLQTARDQTKGDAAARPSETRPHGSKIEVEARSAEAVAENRLDLRREMQEPATRVMNRDDTGGQVAVLRTATTPSQPLSFLSQFDGVVTPGTSGQPAPGAQNPVGRDVVPETRIAGIVTAQDGTGRSVAHQISAALRHQPLLQKIDLSLDPPELGRIEIQMEVAESGMRATLAAERVATSEIIRRQAEVLIQQLDDAGFDDVSLDFRDFGSGDGDRRSQESEPHTSGVVAVPDSVADRPAPTVRRSSPDAGMDIRL